MLASSLLEVFERRDGRIGITCAPVGTSGGVLVAGWSVGSQGEGRGLCPGWLLLSVNGTVTTNDH